MNISEVRSALEAFWEPATLAQHKAQYWAAVRQVMDEYHLQPEQAVQRLLRSACAEIAAENPEGATVVEQLYFQRHSVRKVAAAIHRDKSSVYRLRLKALEPISAYIADCNRQAERRARYSRLRATHRLFGTARLSATAVAELTAADGAPIVVLSGLGGLGKTSLAQQVAYELATHDQFAGVAWVTAKQIEFDVWSGRQMPARPPITVTDLLSDLAAELGIVDGGDGPALAAAVAALCKQQKWLIVLDNLETLADLEAVAPLLVELVEPSRVIITSRDWLDTALPPHLTRRHIALDELSAADSYALLREAARLMPAPALSAASDQQLAAVYEVVGGNPLALWLVAAQARLMDWATFIADLTTNCPRGSRGYELYAYLYRRAWLQLDTAAQRVLLLMHRFESGAQPAQLSRLSGLPPAGFQAAAELLCNRMLLQFDGLYRVHRLTYAFVRTTVMDDFAEAV